jgi:hypothetical protein
MEPPFAEGRPTVYAAVAWASQMHGDQVRRLDEASAVPMPYPYWHQALKAELTTRVR